MQTHITYLALSSQTKGGSQEKVGYQPDGLISELYLKFPIVTFWSGWEVALKSIFSDKTNWRKCQHKEPVDWNSARKQFIAHLPDELTPHLQSEQVPTEISYPVKQYPQKVKSLNLSKSKPIPANWLE